MQTRLSRANAPTKLFLLISISVILSCGVNAFGDDDGTTQATYSNGAVVVFGNSNQDGITKARDAGATINPCGSGSTLDDGCTSAVAPAASAAGATSSSASSSKSNGGSQDCNDAASNAAISCTTTGAAGADPSTMSQIMTYAPMVATLASAFMAGGNTPAQCRQQVELQMALSSLTQAKTMACQQTMAACISTCNRNSQKEYEQWDANFPKSVTSTLYKQYDRDKASASTCQSYSIYLAQGMAQMYSGANQLAQLQSCNALATTPVTAPTVAVDCTNAAVASSSTVCYCQANPTAAMCAGGIGTNGIGSGATLAGPGGTAQPFNPSALTVTGTPIPLPVGSPNPQSGSAAGQNGGAGGGFLGSAAGGGPSGGGLGDGQGSGPSGIDKGVITGTASGAAGGGGGLSAAPNNGSGGGSKDSSNGTSGFNIKDFLPKTKNSRGIAGVAAPGTDGITGAMGPSIWEKVSNQYQNQAPKLIHDK